MIESRAGLHTRTAFFMAAPVEYSDQQILTALRQALYEIAVNGAASWSVNGRTYTSLDLDKLQTAIQIYEARTTRATKRMFAPITFRGLK